MLRTNEQRGRANDEKGVDKQMNTSIKNQGNENEANEKRPASLRRYDTSMTVFRSLQEVQGMLYAQTSPGVLVPVFFNFDDHLQSDLRLFVLCTMAS